MTDETLETRLDCRRQRIIDMDPETAELLREALATLRQREQALEEAEGELRTIDAVLARRPALDRPTRWQNIEKAITHAARADEAERKLAAAEATVVSTKMDDVDHAFDISQRAMTKAFAADALRAPERHEGK